MKILLFGKSGQLGWELQRSLAPLGELIALDSQDAGGNFLQPQEVAHTVRRLAPDVIVNAAAYNAVDQAESEPAKTRQINALTPAILAREARQLNAWLVHYSSDYVFDGSGQTPWTETDIPRPLNVYGHSKAQGDAAIETSGCKYLTLRTSWMYAAHGENFAKTILRLAQEHAALHIVNDQIGAPTGADLLADITAHVLRQCRQTPECAGLYHATASGETSWYDYARFLLAEARKLGLPMKATPESLVPVPSHRYPCRARRPNNSRLNTHKLRTRFALTLPDWHTGITRMLLETLES